MSADRFGAELLAYARHALENRLFGSSGVQLPTPPDPRLSHPGACFITLSKHGDLRGCIGTLEAHRTLADDLHDNALAAAFSDPRFPSVTAAEWPALRIEVSLLSPPQPMAFSDEADALAQLTPGEDGLIFASGGRRSTFLPQVWAQLPSPAQFIARLKEKAGFTASYWAADVTLARYRVSHWQEAA